MKFNNTSKSLAQIHFIKACNILMVWCFIFILQACQQSTKTENNISGSNKSNKTFISENKELKAIKLAQVFKYKYDNSNAKKFGFLYLSDEQSIGVKGVCLYNEYAYLTDPLHGNVKKVNLKNGEIVGASSRLNKNFNLTKLTVFNDLVYVLTDDEIIYILDLNLNNANNLLTPNYRWEKDFFKQTDEELSLYRPIDDVVQLKDKRMKIHILDIDKNNNISTDSIVWSFDKYNNSGYGSKLYNIRGKEYNFTKDDANAELLTIDFGKFELKKSLPTTFQYYESKNIDFTSNRIIFYEITKEELIINVYNY